jgi:hypothetical protein
MNKRCVDGLHVVCNGSAWDYKTEKVTVCHCACHTKR